MQTIINALRSVVGVPDFYRQLTSSSNYTWDYGAMIEYFCAVLILCIVISSIFKFITKLVK